MNEKLVKILTEARHNPNLKQKLIDTFDDMTPDQQRSFLEIGRFYTQPKPGKIAG